MKQEFLNTKINLKTVLKCYRKFAARTLRDYTYITLSITLLVSNEKKSGILMAQTSGHTVGMT